MVVDRAGELGGAVGVDIFFVFEGLVSLWFQEVCLFSSLLQRVRTGVVEVWRCGEQREKRHIVGSHRGFIFSVVNLNSNASQGQATS